MGWISALEKTYDRCSYLAGIKDDKNRVLLPISHSTANAQIEIVIDMDGNFKGAMKVEKENAVTVIPVTEDSASRSSGIAPHPLCDKLCYIAGDMDIYNNSSKSMHEYFETYMKQLEQWVQSPDCPDKVTAVYKYLCKKHVVKDLSEVKVIELDEKGKMTNKKIQNADQTDAFVRFIVRSYNDTLTVEEVWLDQTLYQQYAQYYMRTKEKKALCYCTGEIVPISDKHPAKIRNTGDKAKLISSNDMRGYTFRGRFGNAEQALSVGYETSQKAHNALRWLIERQGYKNGSACIVCWSVDGTKPPEDRPDPMGSTDDVFSALGMPEEEEMIADVAASYAQRLNKAITGYRANLNTEAEVIAMALDTADGSLQGRLAITFYSALKKSEFLDNIESWHKNCSWQHDYEKKGKRVHFTGAPAPQELALAAYGKERETNKEKELKADDKVIKQCIERIFPCIIENRRFPRDIMKVAVENASRPMSMSKNNWKRILSATCAMIKKYYSEKGVEIKMALEKDNDDRSYLFGRLIAVADYMERRTFDRQQDKGRETNAIRYWSAFKKRPARTWEIIYNNLIPYMTKLYPGTRENCRKLLEGIFDQLGTENFKDEELSEMYLVGYHHQMSQLRLKTEMEDKKDE